MRAAVAPVQLEFNDRGDTITVSAWQLLQWKHALRLEAKGMTMTGGRKVSTHLRRQLGLKRNTPISYLSEWVEGALAAVNSAMGIDDEK